MTHRIVLSVAALAAGMLVAAPAEAGLIGITVEEVANPHALTYRVYAQFDDRKNDFVTAVAGIPGSELRIDVLGGGTFFQHFLGTDRAPQPGFFGTFPELEYDSFVTIGAATATGDVTALAPGWPGFSPSSLVTSNSGWFITPADPQGAPDGDNRVLLAQLSTTDGTGFSGTMLVAGFSNGSPFQEKFSFDTQLPGPGALALLGIAGALGGRPRRRR